MQLMFPSFWIPKSGPSASKCLSLLRVWRFIFSPEKGIDSRLEMKTFTGQINFPTLELWVSAHPSPCGSAHFLSGEALQSHLPRLCSSSHPRLFLSCSKHLPLLQLQGFAGAEFHSSRLRVSSNFIFLPGEGVTAELLGMGCYLFPCGSCGVVGAAPLCPFRTEISQESVHKSVT